MLYRLKDIHRRKAKYPPKKLLDSHTLIPFLTKIYYNSMSSMTNSKDLSKHCNLDNAFETQAKKGCDKGRKKTNTERKRRGKKREKSK
jgi:hypothetical protein